MSSNSLIVAEIPYKAKISLTGQTVQVIGPKTLLDKVEKYKSTYGVNPTSWPEIKVIDGEDILINEFIAKAKKSFSLVYPHEELCHCRAVSTEKVFAVIKENCWTTAEVGRTTLAGTGCGSCRKDTEALIKQLKG